MTLNVDTSIYAYMYMSKVLYLFLFLAKFKLNTSLHIQIDINNFLNILMYHKYIYFVIVLNIKKTSKKFRFG
jgi:hypothetical protein